MKKDVVNKLDIYKLKTPEELFKELGKQVRTMPQVKIDDKLVGGYNQLIEYFADKGLVNFKGELIDQK